VPNHEQDASSTPSVRKRPPRFLNTAVGCLNKLPTTEFPPVCQAR
jgi:hypothetical protein